MKENHHLDKNNDKVAPEQEKSVTITEQEYLKLKNEAAECREKLMRLQADFENMRKRLEKDREVYIKFANEGIISELLNVLDDLERAVGLAESKHEDLPAFLKGVEMILAHLYETLKAHGVTPIKAAGEKFDPHFHEALMQVEDKDKPEHTVAEEMQKGYLLNDRVIRTAKVKVTVKKLSNPENQKEV